LERMGMQVWHARNDRPWKHHGALGRRLVGLRLRENAAVIPLQQNAIGPPGGEQGGVSPGLSSHFERSCGTALIIPPRTMDFTGRCPNQYVSSATSRTFQSTKLAGRPTAILPWLSCNPIACAAFVVTPANASGTVNRKSV